MASSRIRILSDQTINKIAAGEVIENPASVVKELVENARDAGATTICVAIEGGGRDCIRVSDNGGGMSRDDALLCLERHATSKIREVEEIQELITMGFRGEAIPSIAAISKFRLLTCPHPEGSQTEQGTLILVEGGKLLSCDSAACAPGTTVEVHSLFFNVPVRRKFQKSPAVDTQEILKIVGLFALAYPHIQFELVSDAKLLLKTSSSSSLSFHEQLSKRLEPVLGKEYAQSLLPLRFQCPPLELEGFIGSPLVHKPNRTGQHLFINRRLVFSPLIASFVREGYGMVLPNHRYPIFVLHLHLPGSYLDVNVHPQKKEVRLRQEEEVKEGIIRAIQLALSPQETRKEEAREPTPFWKPYAPLLSPVEPLKISQEPWTFKEESRSSYVPPLSLPSSPRVLATLVGYCLLEPFHLEKRLFGGAADRPEGGLALLDQRAAYARIHYETFLKHPSSQEVQPLLFPLTFSFSPADTLLLLESLSLLNEMGFGVREFGEQTFVVDAFPFFIKPEEVENCFILLLQDLAEQRGGGGKKHLERKRKEELALAACRASLPSLKRLSIEEAEGLVQQLLMCEHPGRCPRGKPTCVYVSPDEIGQFFKEWDRGRQDAKDGIGRGV